MAASKFTTIPQVQQENLIGTHRNPLKKNQKHLKTMQNNAKLYWEPIYQETLGSMADCFLRSALCSKNQP